MTKPPGQPLPFSILSDAPLVREWGSPEVSPLEALVQERRRQSLPIQDFITANPYDHGFRFNPDLLQEILAVATSGALRYCPDPLGQMPAREAVAQFHGSNIAPGQVALTPGTSMAYFALFRLLARTHGEVLCPAPTYPLFDDLARIAGLRVRRYHLQKSTSSDGTTRWVIDPDELKFQITRHTCAIVLVSPHNPTGSIISHREMEQVCEIANQAGAPLIMDEVFRTYTRNETEPVPRPSDAGAGLSFTLNGISKSHYLPGLKAGWIIAEGDCPQRSAIMNALEYLLDSFLPVQEVTQVALPALLGEAALQEVERLSGLQRSSLEKRLANTAGWNVAAPQCGPYVCLPLDGNIASSDEVQFVSELLTNTGALFHPGHYYAFPEPALVATVYNKAPWPSPPS